MDRLTGIPPKASQLSDSKDIHFQFLSKMLEVIFAYNSRRSTRDGPSFWHFGRELITAKHGKLAC
jgi:hypothetical protein